jgi:hypothetical protein
MFEHIAVDTNNSIITVEDASDLYKIAEIGEEIGLDVSVSENPLKPIVILRSREGTCANISVLLKKFAILEEEQNQITPQETITESPTEELSTEPELEEGSAPLTEEEAAVLEDITETSAPIDDSSVVDYAYDRVYTMAQRIKEEAATMENASPEQRNDFIDKVTKYYGQEQRLSSQRVSILKTEYDNKIEIYSRVLSGWNPDYNESSIPPLGKGESGGWMTDVGSKQREQGTSMKTLSKSLKGKGSGSSLFKGLYVKTERGAARIQVAINDLSQGRNFISLLKSSLGTTGGSNRQNLFSGYVGTNKNEFGQVLSLQNFAGINFDVLDNLNALIYMSYYTYLLFSRDVGEDSLSFTGQRSDIEITLSGTKKMLDKFGTVLHKV